MKKRLVQIFLGLMIVVVLALHVSGKITIGLVNVIENLAYDTRVKLTTTKEKDHRIVILDVDEKSLRELGQWPWPRDNIKTIVDNLFDHYGISVLGFDVVFAESDAQGGRDQLKAIAEQEPDQNLREYLDTVAAQLSGDNRLADSFSNRNIVLGYYFNTDASLSDSVGQLPEPVFEDDGFMNLTLFAPDASGYNANLPVLQSKASSAGFFSHPTIDADGVIRRAPLLHQYNGAIYESLSLAIARNYLDEIVEPIFGEAEIEEGIPLMEAIALGDIEIPFDQRGIVLVPYRGKSGSFPYISASDVFNLSVVDPKILKDTIVIMGTSAIGLADLKPTPVQAVYPGVEVHANVVAGILDSSFKSKSYLTWFVEISSVVIIGTLMALLLPALTPLWSYIVMSGFVLSAVGINIFLWHDRSVVVPLASTLIVIILVYILNTIYGLFKETRHIKAVRKSFSSYLAPALVEKLVDDPASLKLEGESRHMTFLFTDIANFTTFTEKTEAKLLVKVLNEYLDQACQIIMEHGGTIDKMIGDAIVAIYNAPVTLEDHAQRAVQTAVALDQFCEEFIASKKSEGIDMGLTRIGINTGHAVVGNFGGMSRFDYTVIGDSVNTAARLESVNKHLGTRLCVSGSTVALCPDLYFRPIANLVLKGKTEGIDAYEPVSENDYLSDKNQRYIQLYEEMNKNPMSFETELVTMLEAYPDDPVLKLHLDRHRNHEFGTAIVMDAK